MHEKPTSPPGPPGGSGWKFVMHATMGDVETCLWHRKGTNQFSWRPVEKHWDAARMTTERPVKDFIKILVPPEEEVGISPLLVQDV